jgi:GNAT superfamily N-acetyltransferase
MADLSRRPAVGAPAAAGSFPKAGSGEGDFFPTGRCGALPGAQGTICLAEDKATNASRQTRDCIFGFFECIEDFSVAEALFEAAKSWAGRRNLTALFGPFNLDYEDSYGILVEGRDRPPTLLCGHDPPYYAGYMARLGFQPARPHNVAYAMELSEIERSVERLERLSRRMRKGSWATIREADMARWDEMVDQVLFLLNEVLGANPGAIPWQRDALEGFLSPFRRIADPELVLFAEVEGKTVGWFPGIPNLNEIFHQVNGLRYPWNALSLYCRLLYHRIRPTRCLTVKSVLVLKEYWNTSVPMLLFYELGKRAKAKGYQWMDFSLTQADNPHTTVLAERLGARIYKRYQVYRLDLEP